MHFRVRKNAIQVVRTQYDAASKRAKSQIVGRIPKATLEVPEALVQACSPVERGEVVAWISDYGNLQKLKQELAARTLPEQFAQAGEWFETASGDGARVLAATIQREWAVLRAKLKQRKLID